MAGFGKFPERLRDLRAARGLQQFPLAETIGMQSASISAWEAGRSGPNLHRLILLAKSLGASIDYLLGLADSPDLPAPFPKRALPAWVQEILPDLKALPPEKRGLLKQILRAVAFPEAPPRETGPPPSADPAGPETEPFIWP
jgi:transcriptional regulator with XRE-family HTH domain